MECRGLEKFVLSFSIKFQLKSVGKDVSVDFQLNSIPSGRFLIKFNSADYTKVQQNYFSLSCRVSAEKMIRDLGNFLRLIPSRFSYMLRVLKLLDSIWNFTEFNSKRDFQRF